MVDYEEKPQPIIGSRPQTPENYNPEILEKGKDSSLQANDAENPQPEEESAGDGTVASQHYLSGVPLISCMGSLLITMFLIALDQTIVATILTTVGERFNDFGKVSWLTSAFMLPMCVLALSWGKISMILGRKYAMLVAIVLFELGSLICALANSMDMLIGGRVIAGIGASGVQVMVLVIISEIVPVQKRGLAQGLVGASFGFASVAGPLVGGAFTSNVSWRWCFYINLPFGAIAFVCIFYFFRPPMPTGALWPKIKKIDYFGTFLLTSGLILVLLALTFGSTDKEWSSPLVISFFVVGGVLLICFLVWNFRISKDPLVPWNVVKVPSVIIAALCFLFFYGAFMCFVLFTAIYFQVVHNEDALHSGLSVLPAIVPVIIFSILGGVLISKTRFVKPFICIGAAIGTIGAGILLMLDVHTPSPKKIGYLILVGVGSGLSFQSIIISAQLKAPKAGGGVLIATAFASLARQLGGIIGSTVGQTIYTVVFKTKLLGDPNLPTSVKSDISALINSPTLVQTFPEDTRETVLKYLVDAYRSTTYLTIAFFGTTLVLGLFTTNARIPKTKKEPKDDESPESKA